MIYFILWVCCAVMIGIAASRHFGRDGAGWFLLSIIISPLLAGLFLICVGRKPQPRQIQAAALDWRTVNWSGDKTIDHVGGQTIDHIQVLPAIPSKNAKFLGFLFALVATISIIMVLVGVLQ